MSARGNTVTAATFGETVAKHDYITSWLWRKIW